MTLRKLALARVNYSQLYGVYDGGKTYVQRDVLTPYHLLTLAGYLRGHGVECRVFDGEVALWSQERLAREILEWKPDCVGLTATTPDIDLTLEVCRWLKAGDPAVRVIVGGIHASVRPDEVAACADVDHVVAGDGEASLAQLVLDEGRGASAGSAPEKIVRGTRLDLASVPMPAHDLLDYADYQFTDPTRGRVKTATVMSARGCPFDCTFCYHERRVRYRPVDQFLDEIEYLYREKDVRYFFVYDDTFVLKRDRVKAIVEGLRDRQLEGAHFQCQGRGNLVDRELLTALRSANFVRVSLGVESGSTEMLKRCNKEVTKADCLQACALINACGMEPRASFILGHPYETRATAEDTIRFSQELDCLHANFTVMTPYPGTLVYEMARRGEGIRFVKPEFEHEWSVYRRWGKPIVRTEALSEDDLEGLRERAVTEFYTQDRVYQYYATLFQNGNRSRYFYRPLNFAWQKRFGTNVPFWDGLSQTDLVQPV